jgi:hypothetical protein
MQNKNKKIYFIMLTYANMTRSWYNIVSKTNVEQTEKSYTPLRT